MLRHRHWHTGHHQRGHRPCTPVRCFGDPAEAVRALGEAIGEWADTEYERPDDERDADAAYASAIAEIFTGARAPEFHDEVWRVRRGGTGYRLGDRLYWVVPADGDPAQCGLNEAPAAARAPRRAVPAALKEASPWPL